MKFVLGSSLVVLLMLSAASFGQLPSSICDANNTAVADCPFFTASETARDPALATTSVAYDLGLTPIANRDFSSADELNAGNAPINSPPAKGEGFHWRRALTESLTFLLIEQAYVVHTDFRWVVSENGVPFNHYWRDYRQSLSEWTKSGWNDGDPNWFGYLGHPIQGALTGFIQIQNDPRSRTLEFSRTKAYWKSRLKAALWNAAYSTQWNLGPLSEVTVEKYGSKDRAPWNYNGTFPCSRHCLTGVGQIDIVMTPLGGTGWLIAEDFLDKRVVRRIETSTQNHFLIDTARVALNPIRSGANMLHGEHAWYRSTRDGKEMDYVNEQKHAVAADESAAAPTVNRGDFFLGYSHLGTSHCEVPAHGTTTPCDPLSALAGDLSGWNTSIEKMYLRYFGALAEFSGQYGGASETNFLFGLRGGTWVGALRPFAQAMIGAVRTRENSSATSTPDTSFAEDLGVGVDFQITRRLLWRNEIDELKTGSPDFQRYNVRLSSGLAVRF
jgi:hypothetical protein